MEVEVGGGRLIGVRAVHCSYWGVMDASLDVSGEACRIKMKIVGQAQSAALDHHSGIETKTGKKEKGDRVCGLHVREITKGEASKQPGKQVGAATSGWRGA